jgi:hypothetical protein
MATAPPLWEPELTSIPSRPDPSSSPTDRRLARCRERNASSVATDVIEWLNQNEPHDFAELMDLRKALYSRRTTGKYRIRLRGRTLAGEEKLLLTGPAGAVLILSNKLRHFLLRTLCRLRKARRWPPIKYR